MNLRYIEWIWHVSGRLALPPGESNAQAFDRLAPLFDQPGTTHQRTPDTLTFQKKNQAAQDKMSVFDGGVLQIAHGMTGRELHYRLISRALLYCFLAPLFFLAIGQLTITLARFEKPPADAAKSAGKPKTPDKKDAPVPLNPIDKFLGAPAPEKPKKDDASGPGHGKKASPTAAYVFAGLFAALYVIGRVLEDRLVRNLFRNALLNA